MSSAICFSLDHSKILSSGNRLTHLNTLLQKEKLLVQAIPPFPRKFSTLSKTEIIIFVTFNCRLQMLPIWSGPRFCRLGMG